jgi:hypothetical protein
LPNQYRINAAYLGLFQIKINYSEKKCTIIALIPSKFQFMRIICFLLALTNQLAISQSVVLSDTELKLIELVNFVRNAPQQFLEEVAKPYIDANDLSRNPYAKSLIRTLHDQQPIAELQVNSSLMLLARDYCLEAGKKGWTTHVRTSARFKKFAPAFEMNGENLQFGSSDAVSVVMDLLLDMNVRDLGHRKNILDINFTHLGVAFGEHRSYDTMGVMVFGGNP